MYSFKKIALIKALPFILTLAGCVRTVQNLTTQIAYQKDLELTVNGEAFKGAALPIISDKYKIIIDSETNLDLLTLESCHRHISIQNAFNKKRIIKNKKKYIYNFIPSKIERDCFLEITSLSKKDAHSFGLIVFNSERFVLPSIVHCNGDKMSYKGTSICQSKKGLEQKIIFNKRTTVEGTCPSVDINKDGKEYKIVMKKDYCIFIFRDKFHYHRLYTFGYEQIILRDI